MLTTRSSRSAKILAFPSSFERLQYPVSDTSAIFLYPVIPAKRDTDLANLPISTLEGSKPNESPDGGRVVAVRGTGSNAPGLTDEHNPRPSWPCVDEVPVGNNLPCKGGISQEYQTSDEVDKAPQQRAGPFPFETPRIPKSDGLRADPSPPYEPISTQKVQSLRSY